MDDNIHAVVLAKEVDGVTKYMWGIMNGEKSVVHPSVKEYDTQ